MEDCGGNNRTVGSTDASLPARPFPWRLGSVRFIDYEPSSSSRDASPRNANVNEQQPPPTTSEPPNLTTASADEATEAADTDAAAAAAEMGTADITRPPEAMDTHEEEDADDDGGRDGDGVIGRIERDTAVTVTARVGAAAVEGTANMERAVAGGQPVPEAGGAVAATSEVRSAFRIALSEGGLPQAARSVNAVVPATEGSSMFRFSAAFGGADGSRRATIGDLGRERRRMDYRVDGDGMSDSPAGEFAQRKSKRAICCSSCGACFVGVGIVSILVRTGTVGIW